MHVSLMSGRAKRDLCREICLTLKLQMETHSLAPAVDGAHRKPWR